VSARGARDAWLVPAGLAIGCVGSLCGIGGGLFAVPLLHYGWRLDLKRAVATSLVLVLATSLSATLADVLQPASHLDLGLAAALSIGGLAGAELGMWLGRRLGTRALQAAFALLLLAGGWRVIATDAPSVGEQVLDASISPQEAFAGGAIGLMGGALSALLGVGGGLVMVPALYLGIPGVGFALARACSLFAAVFGAGRSLWKHAAQARVDWRPGAWLASGALIGGPIGRWLVDRPGLEDAARILLGAILIGVALRFGLDALRARAQA
jgi:uncharacterized membrane protein YfcA